MLASHCAAPMDYPTGKLAFILIAAVLLSCLGAWGVAHRYRSAMRRLMGAPALAVGAAGETGATGHEPVPPGASAVAPPRPVTAQENRRAGQRLALLLIALSGLLAASSAALFLGFSLDEPFSFKRFAVLALVRVWPVIPVLGLMWRWSRPRLLAALGLWCVLCFAVLWWRSIDAQPLALLQFLAGEIGVPMALVALLFMSAATRAVASWLLPPFVGLVWASMLGIDGLAWMVAQRSPVLLWLTSWLSVNGVIALFALAPWGVAWWPLKRLGRALARAYARKQLSELMVMFTAVWAIVLLVQALTSASSLGLRGLLMLLPLVWVPLVMTGMAVMDRSEQRRSNPASPPRPPTLLVLRVFQRDAQVQALFDQVIERWRLTGNTVLIAGTDLIDRTLDADDIFTFLDGGLAQRFIATDADVAPRLAGFDLRPDAEGRFRINECYCHDTTWRSALDALVQRSDVVLMDLRGFQAHNAGCVHELQTLAQAQRLGRVVVLVDDQTDRAAADAAAAAAPAGRIVWLAAARTGSHAWRGVLRSLFAMAPAPSPAPAPAPSPVLDAAKRPGAHPHVP